MTTFSIIVPVYKAEKYIKDCLESILCQTFEDFEVLCIDDCGNDDSIKIAEKYARYDNRIKIFHQPQNLGVAAARNLALEKATGRYIFNLDSDDWIDKNTLSILYYHFNTSGAESIWFDGYKYYQEKNELSEKPVHNRAIHNDFIDLYPEVLPTFSDMCGMKAYTLESIKRINLKWPTDIKFDEDGEFYFKYYSHYPRVYSINNCLYYYRKHESSVASLYEKGNLASIEDSFKVIQHLRNYYIEKGVYDSYKITLLKLIENRVKFCTETNFSKNIFEKSLKFYNTMNFPDDFQEFEKEESSLVSIVVPFYNVEPYIEQCLRSIMQQTYKNIEIICIDDCGQDNSIEIVKTLEKEDSRIKLVRHRKNKGLGGARNTGLKKATGKYILFVDSDDWISEACVSTVVRELNKTKLNSVCYKANLWYQDLSKETPMNFCNYFNFKEGLKIIDEKNIADCPIATWFRAYRTDFLKINKFFWRENIIYEDVEFFWKLYTISPLTYVIDKPLYFYRKRSDSIMHDQTNNIEKAKKAFFIANEVAKYLDKTSLFKKYKSAYYKYLYGVFILFDNSLNNNSTYQEEKLNLIKKLENFS